MNYFASICTLICLLFNQASFAETPLKIIDAHIHYSHDAWERLPPPKAIQVLRDAGLRNAFVSSSSDEGTQMLYKEAPDFIFPVLRPYRKRGEISSWMHDETVIDLIENRLNNYSYIGFGEFHAFDEDIELPVLQAMIKLAKQHKLFLHAHSDIEAIERIFKTNPNAVVLWAHSGFEDPKELRVMLDKYPNLWSDLAFRTEHDSYIGGVEPEWQQLFEDFPNRFLVGTDTYTPERWYYVSEHASESRRWLATLDKSLANNIAFNNALALIKKAKQQ